MKVLITGGAGFIGSNLALTIQDKFPGAEITILDNISSGNSNNLKGINAEFIKGGIEDSALIKKLYGRRFNVIFNQAAITDTTVTDTKRMMDVNVNGLKNILNLAKSEKAVVVYASSAGVYGNGPIPMKEDQNLLPQNDYAVSKVKDDELAMDFAKENKMRVVGLRYFNVYGPAEEYKNKAASMILQLKNQMAAGKRPRIFKYGEQVRDFIYVKDVVDANLKAMEAKQNTVVNVGTGKTTSFNRIIEVLNDVLGTDYKPDYFDNPYGFYQNNTQADTALSQKAIGFKARYSIEDGIREYIQGLC